jgi:hypothetical protein
MVIKNDYFTYIGPEDHKHRAANQIWNVDGMSIYVQGSAPEFTEPTYFAKKHLLTFAGGKHRSSATITAKMKKIARYRTLPVKAREKRQRERLEAAAKKSKYGGTRTQKNTFINCDYFGSADELKREFSSALHCAQGNHATLELSAAAVFQCENAGEPVPFGDDDREVEVRIEFLKSGNNYLIKHIDGAQLI